MKKKTVLGIDPGLSGSFVVTDGGYVIRVWEMPIEINGKDKSIPYVKVVQLLERVRDEFPGIHIFLERAVPFAMGAKSAFNYGRGFEAVTIAIGQMGLPLTLVEPSRWTKEMHEGTPGDLKPKARSLIAVKRLYPHLVCKLPTKPKGGLYDGPIDALLIAGFGLRRLGVEPWKCQLCGKGGVPMHPRSDQACAKCFNQGDGDFY